MACALLLCAGAGAGNVLLSRHGAVMHLESDVGQPEFTPAGLLSLSLVTKPLLGPPHTHIRTPYPPSLLPLHLPPIFHAFICPSEAKGDKECACRVKAVFYGDVSPEEDPVLYRRCCSELSESFSEQQVAGAKVPLIINTCGWIKGVCNTPSTLPAAPTLSFPRASVCILAVRSLTCCEALRART